MTLLSDAALYARFAWGLPGFLRRRTTLEQARADVQERLAAREQNFLRQLERSIYRQPRGPYRALLDHAGCTPRDVRRLVQTEGLEGALSALRHAGVHVSYDEFKGRAPIIRGSLNLPVEAGDFDNPDLRPALPGRTSGTTGPGTRILIDHGHLAATAALMLLACHAHGLLGAPVALWAGIPPDVAPLACMLRYIQFGEVPKRWYSPLTSRDVQPSAQSRLATWYVVVAARLCGIRMPWPRSLRLDQAETVASWIAVMLRAEGRCVLRTSPSLAVRVSLAAQELGLDLSGATFMGGGEPTTVAKAREIGRCGARWVPIYAMMELGQVGYGCVRPVDADDVHFLGDRLALIQHPVQVSGRQISVEGFYLTSLVSTTPKLLFNVESGDHGILERRACGCPLEALGFADHLRQIRSYRKLTGEGVTLVGGDMERILEEVLPARFGGGPLDFQLTEEEDAQGLTRLNVLVSPRVPIFDEGAMLETVLHALRVSSGAADNAQAHWRQAGTLRIKRQEPLWSDRGKLLPLHLARSTARRVSNPAPTRLPFSGEAGRRPSIADVAQPRPEVREAPQEPTPRTLPADPHPEERCAR